MALLLLEGFDDGLAASRRGSAAGIVGTTYGYNGTKGMLVGDTHGDYFAVDLDTIETDDTLAFGCRINIQDDGPTVNDRYYIGGFVSSYTMLNYYQVVVMVNPTTRAWVVQDRTGYTIGSDGGCQLDTWYYLELKVNFNNSPNGDWELMIDGVSTLTGTSRDTFYSYTMKLQIGGAANNDVDIMWIDDFYLLDDTGSDNNDFLGICAVETDLPSGNGNSSTLVGSDSNSTDNYLLVDNNASVPPATTEYVESDTEGDKDTYAMSDLTTTGVVYGVQTTLYAQKDDSGAKFVRPVIRSGGTDYPGTSVALSDSVYVLSDEVWEQDPDTSSAWLYGDVNSMELGPEIRDS